ncbi:MAG: mannose-1-phosphate guanylyltransferase [Acidobacteria bacterium]|nr:MAG: mannose-1-phosphate guanylyltransferase [Acidobacteriota bacterium]
MLYVVIMAGGKGERFWPLSTPENPKPFLRLFTERSLLQQTFDRALTLVPKDRIYLIVGEKHKKISREQLPELDASHLLLEPTGRDTAAAIGYASTHLPADALMLILPADHLIPDPGAFADTVRQAATFVEKHGGPATFGIHPTRAETNYGYIKALKKNIGSSEFPIHPVDRFIEKPDRIRATKFIKQASYYWNAGIFLWRVSRIQELIQQHLPELWEGLQQLKRARKSSAQFRRLYMELPKISIDFGVMEKADHVVVIPAHFAWDDIGTWTSLLRVLPVNTEGNLIRGNHFGLETTDCILYVESHTIATAGIRDLIVVQRGNQTLICSKRYADRLKELLAILPS